MIIEKVERLCDAESAHFAHRWDKAWIDRGGSLWGPGPYLKLPFSWDEQVGGGVGAERIYCPYGYPEDGEGVKSVELRREGDLWIWIVERQGES